MEIHFYTNFIGGGCFLFLEAGNTTASNQRSGLIRINPDGQIPALVNKSKNNKKRKAHRLSLGLDLGLQAPDVSLALAPPPQAQPPAPGE
jgi:hypothetical protein